MRIFYLLASGGFLSGAWALAAQATQTKNATDVAGSIIEVTGRRVPELLLMLCAFALLCFVVWVFVKYLEKRDDRNHEHHQEALVRMEALASGQMEVIRDNTKALRDGEVTMGKVLTLLDRVEAEIRKMSA